jgi:hypothetical protein
MYGGFVGVHKQEPIVGIYCFGGNHHQIAILFARTMQHKGHIVCRPICDYVGIFGSRGSTKLVTMLIHNICSTPFLLARNY